MLLCMDVLWFVCVVLVAIVYEVMCFVWFDCLCVIVMCNANYLS